VADVIARVVNERGELVLRRRPTDRALELRANGVFVMDTREVSSERLLASTAIAAVRARLGEATSLRVLIGGLGLGFTLSQVLADPNVAEVLVVEIEPELVGWHRQGLIGVNDDALADPRTRLAVADVRAVIADGTAHPYELILLDVDNGPGYLVHDANADLYAAEMLSCCRRACRSGGAVAVWSAAAAPELAASMATVFDSVDVIEVPVRLGERMEGYWLYLGRRDVSSSGT
jgi:spermidine synthase